MVYKEYIYISNVYYIIYKYTIAYSPKVNTMSSNKVPALIAVLIISLVVLSLSGCASPTPTAAPVTTPTPAPSATPVPGAILVINGSVATPLSLTLADLQAYPQNTINVSTTNQANVTTEVNGTGPLLNTLLDAAAPLPTAMNITFMSSDYSKTIALSVVTGSPNATVIIFSDGSLRDVIPGQGAGAWVANLSAITLS
jgi:hypothetical protein